MKKFSLELGGKNPFIITENAELKKAVSTAMRAAFTNQGQSLFMWLKNLCS